MAPIKCPDCGIDVSSKAPNCPKCGSPIGQQMFQVPGQRIDPKSSIPFEVLWLFQPSLEFREQHWLDWEFSCLSFKCQFWAR